MAIKNILQYVQACLSTMDSDEVDSIGETAEATQVANLLSDCYDELIQRQEWEFLKGPVTLIAGVNPALPTQFTLPTNLRHLYSVWYNTGVDGNLRRQEICYLCPEEFLRRYGSGPVNSDRQLVTVGNQIQFYIRNNHQPSHYTSFDAKTLYFDSFDSGVETTLVSNKVSAFGISNPQFTVSDGFIPLLPEHMVPLLQATLNAAAHLYFKQQASSSDEVRARRQLAQARNRESTLTRDHYYSNRFGRR